MTIDALRSAVFATRRGGVSKERIFRLLGYEPHPSQWTVHRSVAPRRVLACGVRWGKTKSSAFEGIAASLHPSPRNVVRRGWVVAPSYDLCDKVFREIALEVRSKLPELIIKLSDSDRLLLMHNMGGGMCEVRGKTADNPDSLLGEGLDWLIVDEAARLRPFVWERMLSARLVDKKGWALLISTPKGKGWFYDLWKRGLPGADQRYQSWNMPTWSNPHIDKAEVLAVKERVPDVIFQQEYAARFIEGAGSVFRNVRDCAILTKAWPPWVSSDGLHPEPERSYYAGLDLARTEDYTVLVVVDDLCRVVYHDRFTKLDWSIQLSRLRAALSKFDMPPTLVDSTGMGEPIFEQLRGAELNVKPYCLTAGSKQRMVDSLAIAFEHRAIQLPVYARFPQLVDELESFQYTITDHGNWRTGAPVGYHDDCVIALGLAVMEARNEPYFEDAPLL